MFLLYISFQHNSYKNQNLRKNCNTIQDETEEKWKISLNNEKIYARESQNFC